MRARRARCTILLSGGVLAPSGITPGEGCKAAQMEAPAASPSLILYSHWLVAILVDGLGESSSPRCRESSPWAHSKAPTLLSA